MSTDPPGTGSEPTGSGSSRNATMVSAGILLSRAAGLIREVVTAGFLGVGLASDAFKAALRIPNLLQNLLGTGVLSASFVPVYTRLLGQDEEEAGKVAGAVLGVLAAAVAALVVVGMVVARPLTIVLTPGFRDDPEKLNLTVDLVRIMFPGVGFLVLSAWCLAVLNSHRRFFLSYVAPVLWNLAQIVTVVAVAVGGSTQVSLANALAWGVLIGGAAQFGIQFPAVRALVPKLRVSLDHRRRSVRDVLGRVGPVVWGRGVVQISGYIDLVLASVLATGAVTAGQFAQVLYLLPVAVFGMAVAAAELPELAVASEQDRLRVRLNEGLRRISYFVVPTTVFYLALGEPIVRGLFERGEFGADDSRLVWMVLAAYSLGLIATSAARLLQNVLYALDDPRSPARIALVRVVVSAVTAVPLMLVLDERAVGSGPLRLGAVGIALGSAVGAWIEFALLRAALAWRVGSVRIGDGTIVPLAGAAAVSAALGGLAWWLAADLPPAITMVVVLAPAGVVYILAAGQLGFSVREMVGRR